MRFSSIEDLAPFAALAACVLLLAFLTAFNQVKARGLGWQEEHYYPELETVLEGVSPPPAQYRLLSSAGVATLCGFAKKLGVPRPVGTTFVAVRLLQLTLFFSICLAFYRRLGIPAYLGVLGLMALAWAMTQSNFNSTLAFDFYTELILYLAAGWCLAANRAWWIVPLSIAAALNRETGVLIPVMAFVVAVHNQETEVHGAPRLIGLASLLLFLCIQILIRLRFGISQDPTFPSFGMLFSNVIDLRAWAHLVGTLGLIPVIAFMDRAAHPPVITGFLVFIVPAWLIGLVFLAPVAESRYLLLPLALVLLPAALCVVQRRSMMASAAMGIAHG